MALAELTEYVKRINQIGELLTLIEKNHNEIAENYLKLQTLTHKYLTSTLNIKVFTNNILIGSFYPSLRVKIRTLLLKLNAKFKIIDNAYRSLKGLTEEIKQEKTIDQAVGEVFDSSRPS